MSNRKKNMMILIIIGVLAMGSLVASAERYTSTLYLSLNSTTTGAYRDYTGSSHKIEVTVASREYHSLYTNNVNIQLHRKTLLGYDGQATRLINMPTVGQAYPATWSGQSNGTYRYFFSNYGISGGDAFTSDYVVMTSN